MRSTLRFRRGFVFLFGQGGHAAHQHALRRDGWSHLALVIDCADREIIGWRLSHSAKAHVAEAALEDALIRRFGPRPLVDIDLLLRSDKGLIFMAQSYRQTVRDYGLRQEYITPYTPEQNGLLIGISAPRENTASG